MPPPKAMKKVFIFIICLKSYFIITTSKQNLLFVDKTKFFLKKRLESLPTPRRFFCFYTKIVKIT